MCKIVLFSFKFDLSLNGLLFVLLNNIINIIDQNIYSTLFE